MLRNCVCFGRPGNKRRSSSFEDTSSCRSSEIERGGALAETRGIDSGGGGTTSGRGAASSLLQLFQSRGWYRHWRKAGRDMSMTKIERTMKAALLIQLWYRRYLARMEMRRKYTWTIFQSIEYADEQSQMELYNFFNALLTHIPVPSDKQAESPSASVTSSADNLESKYSDESDYQDEGGETSTKSYRGPHIKFPLQKGDIPKLIDLFRKKKNNRLHVKYVAGILREAASRMRRMPNLNKTSTAISKQLTIIGDLHGKLDDLLVVFHKNGLPSIENPYVFNGDFVDRGKKGLEVFLLLLACFLGFPGAVFLNRGNHEDSVMNARYGFIREVQQKYKHNSEKILNLIEEVYRWLPLGTIVNNRVLIVHGGISDTTNLDLIKSLDRGKYISILRPPVDTRTSTEEIDKVEWKQIFDIMWSDPQHNEGCIPNGLRGAGTYFGPDVTADFLSRNKLKYLVRSHECKPDGYEFTHNDKVITIFSASNYYATGSNKGAYMKLNPHLDPHFVQYTSAASKTSNLTFRQRIGLIESSAIRELGARLRDHRDELEEEFRKHDKTGNGTITVSQWCDTMEKVTKLGITWRLVRDKLAPMPDDAPTNEVNYFATLQLLDTDIIKAAQAAETSVTDSLYKNKSSLEAIFHILDTDNSGHISLDEFAAVCELLEKHLRTTTRAKLLETCKLMDINKDGFVDLNEFLEAFRLSDQSRKQTGSPSTSAGRSPKRLPSKGRESVYAMAATLVRQPSEAEVDIDPRDHVAQTARRHHKKTHHEKPKVRE